MSFNSNPKTVSIFGVTGSVGTSAQEVIMLNKDNFVVDTIVSNNNVKALIKAAILLNPKLVIIRNKEKFSELEEALVNIILYCFLEMKIFWNHLKEMWIYLSLQ